ncbi:hypothetical protein H5410_006863 [Solanum commersonii]|uniref:Uncharacterized protein n=1 Tax=Solanum commersonii TaxID=4109 RepID=A0A9J6AAI2_SOLCO|nr:hypothetical protein H5410_006863 [Solanum commersonii]
MGNLFCCVQVDQSTVAIKEKFGNRVAGYLTLRLQQLDVRCETKSKDNVFVTIVGSIQYYRALVDKATDAFYKLSDTRSKIQSYVFDASVPKLDLDDVFEQKNQIAKAVEDELEKFPGNLIGQVNKEICRTVITPINIPPNKIMDT